MVYFSCNPSMGISPRYQASTDSLLVSFIVFATEHLCLLQTVEHGMDIPRFANGFQSWRRGAQLLGTRHLDRSASPLNSDLRALRCNCLGGPTV